MKLNSFEKELIFGPLLENIDSIVSIDEEIDPISGEDDENSLKQLKTASVAATNKRVAASNNVRFATTKGEELAAKNAAKNAAKEEMFQKSKLINAVNHDVIRENSAVDNITKSIESKERQKEDIINRETKNKQSLDKQIQTLKDQRDRIRSAEEAANDDSDENKLTEENEIEKKQRIADEEQTEKKIEDKQNGLAKPEESKLTEEATNKNDVLIQNFGTGTAGDAFLWLVGLKSPDKHSPDYKTYIAIKDLPEVKAIKKRSIDLIMKYSGDGPCFDLSVEKSKYRNIFYKNKKEKGI